MSSHTSHDDEDKHEKLGIEVVEILRSNTRLNYDVCAFNLIEIFQVLGSRLSGFSSSSQGLIEAIKVGF